MAYVTGGRLRYPPSAQQKPNNSTLTEKARHYRDKFVAHLDFDRVMEPLFLG